MSAASPSSDLGRWQRQYRLLVGFFIVALVLSGVTAFPLLTELRILCRLVDVTPGAAPELYTGLRHWLLFVHNGLADTYARYPFIAYGTDWLAFGHIVIALFFVPLWREPGEHLFVLRVGMAACLLVIPLALICGPIRGIPFYWRLIDCSFGVFGLIPLWAAARLGSRINKHRR